MIGTIEQAMIDHATAVSAGGDLGYALNQVDTYAGQFDEDVSEIAKDFPLVFFAWSGEWGPPESIGQNAWQYKPVFAAIAGVKSLRNEKDSRHGGAPGEVGSYQMITDLRAMFNGRNLGLDIRPFEPGQARSLFNRRVHDLKVSVLVAEFRTEYVGEPAADDTLDDFETFHADWDIPAHDGHTSVPLAAEDADATDDVTLET